MIELRQLEIKDAPFMIEWMHDPDIQKGFKKDMLGATIDDAVAFIKENRIIPEPIVNGISIHYAIVDDNDEYLGTTSLKNIDTKNGTAEYAITTRKKAQKKGTAYKATVMMLNKAFFVFNLRRVYLSVFSNNIAAIKLYEKCGFVFEGEFREHFVIDGDGLVNWKWYGMMRDEFCQK